MGEIVRLDDAALETAVEALRAVSWTDAAPGRVLPSVDFDSLTGIADAVRGFVHGLDAARAALAAAARTASEELAGVVRAGDELDGGLGAALAPGVFAPGPAAPPAGEPGRPVPDAVAPPARAGAGSTGAASAGGGP
ncbi:hypothetical protein MUN78_12445 [Leucobacter allii]|uniref:PE domain-containing protein n=1 Tax=Leucobacter allii TaxID=2932247 RepID=A0ABY4FII4_9MICO|nr:hypothetical protein [Leucobacter allii]UOQ56481.1 hypothetical protein MUN78_12445 [Leucobacter allii]